MGRVHRYDPEDEVGGGPLLPIETSILGWLHRGRSDPSDDQFLSESRAAYMASVPESGIIGTSSIVLCSRRLGFRSLRLRFQTWRNVA